MSITLDRILGQAIDNYPITAIISPEVMAVLLYALSQIENPETWLDETEDPFDQISDADKDAIDELVAGANMAIITPRVGNIQAFITAIAPSNTLYCDGSTYNREDFPFLYAVLDPIFIIDADTFIVPDMRGLVLVGQGMGHIMGETGGEETHQLTETELASHSHTLQKTITTLVLEPGEVPALTPIPILVDFTGSTGGDAPHNNMQPYGVVKYCVVAR